MITLSRDGFRVEASAVPEPDGFCCVTAEVYQGRKMLRGYYRRVEVTSAHYEEAERQVAEDVARMSSEAE
jgi:hypothetical protein